MRVIVTLATAQWRQWPDHVRQRAIDLYPPAEDVEFWDASDREGESDNETWGAWPRFCDLGPEAVVADLVDEVLAAGDNPIAIILVAESPLDLLLGRNESPRDGPSIRRKHLEDLDTSLQQVTKITRRIVRLCVFRSGAQSDEQRAEAWQLIISRLLDGVVFIDVHGAGRDERQFDALRILVDAVRAGAGTPSADSFRASPVNGTPAGGLNWLHPPDRNAVALAGAEQASLMAGFIRTLTEAEGVGRGGESLSPLELLENAVEGVIREAESRTTLARTKADEDEKANGEIIVNAGLPSGRTDSAVQQWWSALAGEIADKYARRPEDVAVAHMGVNQQYIRGLEDLLSQASKIAGDAAGLTDNARDDCEKILRRVEERRRAWSEQARLERQTIDELFANEEGLIGTNGRFQLDRLETYRDLEDNRLRELRHAAANMPDRRWTAAVAIGLILAFYSLLVLQTRGWAQDDDWLAAIILGPTWARILVLLAMSAAAGVLWFIAHRRADARWHELCSTILDRAAVILAQAHKLVRHTMLYRGCTEVASGLAPVQTRIGEIVAGMRDGKQRLNDAARLLGVAGRVHSPLDQEKFNDRQNQIKTAPVREWVRGMMTGARYEEMREITLSFGTNRTGYGNVVIQSRQSVSDVVWVEGLSP